MEAGRLQREDGAGGVGARTCIACMGTGGMLVHAWAACLPSLFAIGDPRGAAGLVSGGGCGVFSLSARGLDCRPPPLGRGTVSGSGVYDPLLIPS